MNNRNLDGALVKMRESIASFCATYNPSTNATVTAMCERIGMDIGQGSNILTKLEDAGEIKRVGKMTYLLRLDDYQLETITVENYELLETLAELGCVEAAKLIASLFDRELAAENLPQLQRLAKLGSKDALKMLETISKDIEINSNTSAFLMHFFLFSNLSLSQESLNHSQPQFEIDSGLNEINSNALKEDNVLKSFPSNVSKDFIDEDEKNPSQNSSSRNEDRRQPEEDSDESTAGGSMTENQKTEVPRGGEGKPGKKTEVPLSGEGASGKQNGTKPKGKSAKNSPEEKQTRPDIADDADWLVWLKDQPENRRIDVIGKYKEMLNWCREKRKTPSRLRLVRWLAQERESLPMEFSEPAVLPPPSPLPSNGNGNQPIVETLTETEREETLVWLKTKADWFFYEDQFLPEDWVWLKDRLEKKEEEKLEEPVR